MVVPLPRSRAIYHGSCQTCKSGQAAVCTVHGYWARASPDMQWAGYWLRMVMVGGTGNGVMGGGGVRVRVRGNGLAMPWPCLVYGP